MKHELEPLGRTILLEGRSDGIGILDRKQLSDEQLSNNDLLFQRCGRLLGWEWADNTAEMIDRKMREQAKQKRIDLELPEESANRCRENVREYAEIRGLAAHTVLIRVCVADFFPMAGRRSKLDFSHHITVWEAGLNIGEAYNWLDKAQTGDGRGKRWSISELRAAIKATKTKDSGEPSIDDDVPREVSAFECWAATRWNEMQDIAPLDALRMLSEMQTVVRLIDHLRATIGTANSFGQPLATPQLTPGKESLRASSKQR